MDRSVTSPGLTVASWTATRETLHMWLQIVGKTRMINAAAQNHYWHVTLLVTSTGLTTGLVPLEHGAFEIAFDFRAHVLVLRTSAGEERTIPLRSMTVADFYGLFQDAAAQLGIPAGIHPVPNEVETAIPFDQDVTHATYVPEHAHAFWQQLVEANGDLQQHRAQFRGKSSPVHFFWGALDLAVTRFSGRPAPAHPGGVPNCPDDVMTESYSAELASAGFWPGGGEEGAYYAYMYPESPGYRQAPVPAGARYDSALGEFLLPYETVRASPDPRALVREFLDATFAAAEASGWRDSRTGVAPPDA
jgi:hypothetical protein